MKKPTNNPFPMLAALLCMLLPAMPAQAAEVDFSCMNYRVWSKSHLSSEYRSFDIVVQNQCPGSVYWAMCIERIDPDTFVVAETHNPTGYVEEGKKARVNLNLRKHPNDAKFRSRFQEFYVDVGYSIDGAPAPNCFASQCEAKKRSLRLEIRENENVWEQAERALSERIKNECPDTGWDTLQSQECEDRVKAASQAELQRFEATDLELREQVTEIEPGDCRSYSGELAE
ncbi:MAG: hypothetical protein HKO99_01435 [Xanthomonadales bacterium]|nr:hypothetical protein [Gammaproteobacteria bacterium]MBT8053199.1 hypothetical protein [Gammaproteobacteria bacterium]NNK50238.1 hypothetical protein [Xanthomonadales bacterium]